MSIRHYKEEGLFLSTKYRVDTILSEVKSNQKQKGISLINGLIVLSLFCIATLKEGCVPGRFFHCHLDLNFLELVHRRML